ncbi:MAG: ABC transporter permease [Planctomycetota bacterium]
MSEHEEESAGEGQRESETAAGTETGTETETGTGTETESETETETGTGTESETEPETEAATETAAGKASAVEPEGVVGAAVPAGAAKKAGGKAEAEDDVWDERFERLERRLNPLVYKDLLTYTRGAVGGTARVVAYGIFFALPLVAFAWALAFLPGPHRFAMRHVFLGVCGLMAFLHLGVAVPASTAFALERDRDTLESLIVSPLHAWRLVLGKLGTALTVGLLTKGAILPPLAVAFALGGGDLGFLPRYLLLLVCVDLSLAAFALHMGCRHRDAPSQLGWVKHQTTQTQLALQATIGISVLSFLLPFYAIGFLIPLSLQHGVRVAEVLEVLAPLGALHPLAALTVWGEADIFGWHAPIWLLGVCFHLALALPLLSGTADSQRPEGSAPNWQTRLLTLPVLLLGLLIVGAVLRRSPQVVRVPVGLSLLALLQVTIAVSTGFSEESGRPVTVRGVLGSFHPLRALESTPARSPGYVLLFAVLSAPFFVWVGGAGSTAVASWAATALAAVSVACAGARLSARVREQEDEAFLEALGSRGQAAGEEEDSDEETDEEAAEKSRRSAPRRYLGHLFGIAFLLPPLMGVLLLAIESGIWPPLAALRPVIGPLTSVGLSLNPFTGLLPVLADPRLLGSDLPLRVLEQIGVIPWVVFLGHVVAYGALLVAALATLRPPLDLEAALVSATQAEPETHPA